MKSESLTLTSRVPQGSVLGPLLFLIYVNHLSNFVYSSVALLFADDLKVILQGNYKTLTKLQNDLNNLHCWSIQNHLLFNYKKCSLTDFKVGKRTKPPVPAVFMLGNNEIIAKTPVKDVGLVISENLSWTDYLNCRIGKAMKAFFSCAAKYFIVIDVGVKDPPLPSSNIPHSLLCIRMLGTTTIRISHR